MTSSIGLRFYQVTAHVRNSKGDDVVPDANLSTPLDDFVRTFVSENSVQVRSDSHQRSWYFDEQEGDGPNSVRGHILYGTFGFESTFRDVETKEVRYSRGVKDVEEVPLFFEFWRPEGQEHFIFTFQSFQGRSCVTLVLERIRERFEDANPGVLLRIKKLLAVGSTRSLYANAPVKKLTLIKSHVSADRFSTYAASGRRRHIDVELAYKAGRGGALGTLADFFDDLSPNDDGIVVFDGQEFDQAVATVMIGRQYRPVGLAGPTADTGAVDVTEAVEWGLDGHPTFDSIAEQATMIALDMNRRIGERPA
ncbi:hypothetical protein [Brevundimonas sp. PWP3-1b1]|uniref:hypothetical protein n=1 Tax=unclassified Brevundimonas TaxID=2622653 RepID=UPI003CF466F5